MTDVTDSELEFVAYDDSSRDVVRLKGGKYLQADAGKTEESKPFFEVSCVGCQALLFRVECPSPTLAMELHADFILKCDGCGTTHTYGWTTEPPNA